MKTKNKIIILAAVVLIIGLVIIFVLPKDKKNSNEVPKYVIEKSTNTNCQYIYGKLCFSIPDDYKCVGANNCQLSNDNDMLLVEVFIEENYKDSLEKYLEINKKGYSALDNQETKEIKNTTWIVGDNKYKIEKYYYTKVDNDIYEVKLLSMKDSGGKYDELIKVIEGSIKINN